MKERLENARERVWVSQYTVPLTRLNAEIDMLRNKYSSLKKQTASLQIGQKCPTCHIAATAEILNIYRNRDVVEKSFDNLKNEIDMKRLHCHTYETVKGKVFVSFVALVIRSYMLQKLSNYMQKNGLTFRKIINELDKIKCLDLNNKSKPRLLNPITKTQKDLLSLLNINSLNCIG